MLHTYHSVQWMAFVIICFVDRARRRDRPSCCIRSLKVAKLVSSPDAGAPIIDVEVELKKKKKCENRGTRTNLVVAAGTLRKERS